MVKLISTIRDGRSCMGEPEFMHKAGCYRVTFGIPASGHGLSIFVEDTARGSGVSTAIRSCHLPAFVDWIARHLGHHRPAFAIVTERVDGNGDTHITRQIVPASGMARYIEDMWPSEGDMSAKLKSMRVGDMFALGRSNRRDTIVCIDDGACFDNRWGNERDCGDINAEYSPNASIRESCESRE